MTPTTERSTMIAVYADHNQANQAIDELRRAGYGYDGIRLVERGASNFIENLKSLFASPAVANTNSADDWMRIGVPEQDAHNYQSELDAGRSIVLIKAVENPEQAMGILRQSGAYDIASRLRLAQPNMATRPNGNAQPGAYDPSVTQEAANAAAQRRAYDPNVAPQTPNGNVQPEAYDPNMAPQTPNGAAQPGAYDPNVAPKSNR